MIDAKIEALERAEDKEKCEEIKTQANAMLENVKHAIVLLQIAKNTVHPINGIYKKAVSSQPEFAMVTHGVAFGAECKEAKDSAGSEVDGELRRRERNTEIAYSFQYCSPPQPYPCVIPRSMCPMRRIRVRTTRTTLRTPQMNSLRPRRTVL